MMELPSHHEMCMRTARLTAAYQLDGERFDRLVDETVAAGWNASIGTMLYLAHTITCQAGGCEDGAEARATTINAKTGEHVERDLTHASEQEKAVVLVTRFLAAVVNRNVELTSDLAHTAYGDAERMALVLTVLTDMAAGGSEMVDVVSIDSFRHSMAHLN
jgi:hypothetical protein